MLGKKRRKSTQTNLQQINKSTKNWSHMKKNPTTIFTQLLRTKAIKNKKKNKYSEKTWKKKKKKKNLTLI
jgi:hypothetical protein